MDLGLWFLAWSPGGGHDALKSNCLLTLYRFLGDGAGLVLYKFVLINIFVFVSIDIFVADSIEAGRLGRKRGGSPRPNPPSHPH